MCNKCMARNVVVIGSMIGLAQSLAGIAQTLDNINATPEKNMALKRLREVLAVPHEELEVDDQGKLVQPERDDPFEKLMASLSLGEPAEIETPKADPRNEDKASEAPKSFGEFLGNLLNELQSRAERRENGEASSDDAGPAERGIKLTKEIVMVRPAGATDEEVDYMVRHVAKLQGVAPSDIKVV